MRFSPRTWSLLSLLLFVAAAFFWLKGNEAIEKERRERGLPPVVRTPASNATSQLNLFSTRNSGALAQLATLAPEDLENGAPSEEQLDRLHPYRLRNTRKALDELVGDDNAILLANALIDGASGEPLEDRARGRGEHRGD